MSNSVGFSIDFEAQRVASGVLVSRAENCDSKLCESYSELELYSDSVVSGVHNLVAVLSEIYAQAWEFNNALSCHGGAVLAVADDAQRVDEEVDRRFEEFCALLGGSDGE